MFLRSLSFLQFIVPEIFNILFKIAHYYYYYYYYTITTITTTT